MLMARPPPSGNGRNGHVPEPITLPSFGDFCAGMDPNKEPPRSAQLPRATTDPSEYARSLVSPRHVPGHDQVPYSPRHNFYHPPQGAVPHEAAQTPQFPPPLWNISQPQHPPLPIHHNQQRYSEPFSPSRSHPEVNPHTKIVIQERVVDGKGLCYVYSDGTTCPKLINGDTVNPKWGTTKAGKPRKRLGQACNTCREKKIRCDPQVPKCAQCQKFGRECKFETSVRGSQRGGRGGSAEGSSPPSDRRGSIQYNRPSSSESMENFHERAYSSSSIAIDNLLSTRPASSEDLTGAPSSKKRKFSLSPNSPVELPAVTSPIKLSPDYAANLDPFAIDTALAQYYFDSFMEHFNSTLYHIYPQEQFSAWACSTSRKSSADILLLYVILSLGTVFCPARTHPRTYDHARAFDEVVSTGLQEELARPTLQLAQTLLLLSYRKLSQGDVPAARQTSSQALQVCLDLGLNQERETHTNAVRPVPAFSLHDDMFDECCRRTFWVAYIKDTTMTYCIAASTDPPKEFTCTLKIPCKERSYDSGSILWQPQATFEPHKPHIMPFSPNMGRLAVFAQGFTILRDALTWISRTKRMSRLEALNKQCDNQQALLKRAEEFFLNICKIDPRQRKSKEGLAGRTNSSKEEPREGFILYHFVKMIIFRHVRHDCLLPEQIATSVNGARAEAFALLNLLSKLRDSGTDPIACPVAAFALFTAIDITTAAGAVASLHEHITAAEKGDDPARWERTGTGSTKTFTELLTIGIEVLEGYSAHWATARQQLEVVSKRLVAVRRIAQSAIRQPGYHFAKALHSPFGTEADIVYGLERVRVFEALGMGERVRGEADLYGIGL